MQEDKEPLFDTLDTVRNCLRINTEMLKTLKFKKDKIGKVLKGGYITATDLADYLAKKGIPFRNAHKIAGKVVAFCEDKGIELEELEFDEFKKFSDLIDMDIYENISVEGSVGSKNSYGGTSSVNVIQMIKEAKEELTKMNL